MPAGRQADAEVGGPASPSETPYVASPVTSIMPQVSLPEKREAPATEVNVFSSPATSSRNKLESSSLSTSDSTPPMGATRQKRRSIRKRASSTHSVQERLRQMLNFAARHLNFYRLHLIFFTLGPIAVSGIFYAANGQNPVSYVDALFMCFSAFTVCGLTSVNVSSLTCGQQAILYILMWAGSFSTVAWFMVIIRRHYFQRRCEELLVSHKLVRTATLHYDLVARQSAELANSDREHQQQTRSSCSNAGHSTSADLNSGPSTARSRDHPLQRVLTEHRVTQGYQEAQESYLRAFPAEHPGPAVSFNAPEAHQTHRGPVKPGYHGFGEPIKWCFGRIAQSVAPKLAGSVARWSSHDTTVRELDQETRPWLSFSGLKAGRNSVFNIDELSEEQIEALGGVEYQALEVLAWLLPVYAVGIQLVGFIMMASYFACVRKYDDIFQNQVRPVNQYWWSAFILSASFSGTGMSPVDTGLIDMPTNYLVIVVLLGVIFAGNMGLPVLLRFLLWTTSILSPKNSELKSSTTFLLEHPRRTFLYLFPAHQTWFLLLFTISISAFEWIMYIVLNQGLPLIQNISLAQEVISGVFQSITGRSSGIPIIVLSDAAPAMQFLWIVAMYIAILPVAMAVRSTNVYEEQGLGVYSNGPGEEPEKEEFSRYLSWHIRKQLSFDLWWLVGSIWIICICERGKLRNEDNFDYFNLFSVIFEMVSAFAGVGLSLGLPYNNFSLAGSFSTFGKLVVCATMVRGRLRGLPNSVDRAVMLPGVRDAALKHSSVKEIF